MLPILKVRVIILKKIILKKHLIVYNIIIKGVIIKIRIQLENNRRAQVFLNWFRMKNSYHQTMQEYCNIKDHNLKII